MLTLRPTASTCASWTSSRTTLSPDDETEPLLPRRKALDDGSAPFAFTAEELARMFDPRSLELFREVGGLVNIAKGLHTDLYAGLSSEKVFDLSTSYVSTSSQPPRRSSSSKQFKERSAFFGENKLPKRQSKTLIQLMLIAISDRVLLLLTVVSIISLALGIYQSVFQPHEPGQPRVEWVEGATIMTAVAIAVIVGSINDYQKERQFVKLNRKVCTYEVRSLQY
jgi:P-type Ca2+ transporter type 2C